MPILKDHLQEMDITYTPLEKRRREEMGLRTVRYGMFTVPNEPRSFPICISCHKEIYGLVLSINGKTTHYHPCAQ